MAEVKGGRSLGQQIQVLGSPVISLCPEVFNDLGSNKSVWHHPDM